MKLRARLVGLASLVLFAACAPQEAADTSQTQQVAPFNAQELSASLDRFVSLWNAGDTASLGALIADDAVLMQPDGPPIEGRAAILGTIAGGYDIAMYQQTATADEILSLGDYAYARGTWTLNPTAAAGDEAPVLSGKWMAVYTAGPDGDWLTWRWMWNQPSGQAAPAAD